MACPECGGVLTRWGHGRIRTVRALGSDTVTVQPSRVRCTACLKTQVLLPAELHLRRADTTQVIGNALLHKANGLGFRRIAARMDRPESTVSCLLYTSDAADEEDSVDLGGRRIIKKK